MAYISLNYYIMVAIALVVYYVLPLKYRWLALLAADICFLCAFGPGGIALILLTSLVSWLFGLLIQRLCSPSDAVGAADRPGPSGTAKAALTAGILLTIAPWLAVKLWPLASGCLSASGLFAVSGLVTSADRFLALLVPLGISFYTLQIIAYLVDIYRGRFRAQGNFAKYLLFVTFFPQLIQGPIPRYEELSIRLYEGHPFNQQKFTKGFYLIIWGFFLKLMIADKLGVIVDAIYADYRAYAGIYVWIAMAGYMVQLYADFLACTTLARAVALLFGVELAKNFRQPFLSQSIAEIWRRWHISLSSWLKDYIYIPLGGNRKGTVRKYINVLITFTVSGFWHGTGLNFLVWGLLNGIYQVAGALTNPSRERIYAALGIPERSIYKSWAKRAGTFFLFSFSFILFRAPDLVTGLKMIRSMTVFNPWILTDGSLFALGLSGKELIILAISLILLVWVDRRQDEGSEICAMVIDQPVVIRFALCVLAVLAIAVFGTYGYGFNAQDFIYGGF